MFEAGVVILASDCVVSSFVSLSFQDAFNEAEATALTEHCELIGVRLMTLEDELQAAMLNEDQALTHIL